MCSMHEASVVRWPGSGLYKAKAAGAELRCRAAVVRRRSTRSGSVRSCGAPSPPSGSCFRRPSTRCWTRGQACSARHMIPYCDRTSVDGLKCGRKACTVPNPWLPQFVISVRDRALGTIAGETVPTTTLSCTSPAEQQFTRSAVARRHGPGPAHADGLIRALRRGS